MLARAKAAAIPRTRNVSGGLPIALCGFKYPDEKSIRRIFQEQLKSPGTLREGNILVRETDHASDTDTVTWRFGSSQGHDFA
jgi:hypothetical protein